MKLMSAIKEVLIEWKHDAEETGDYSFLWYGYLTFLEEVNKYCEKNQKKFTAMEIKSKMKELKTKGMVIYSSLFCEGKLAGRGYGISNKWYNK